MGTFHIKKASELQVGDVLALPFEQYVEITHITFGRDKVTLRSRAGIAGKWDRDDEVSVQNTTTHHLIPVEGRMMCKYCGEYNVSTQDLCPEGTS